MKRAILVGGGTLAGVAAVLALNPDAGTTATASGAGGSSVSSGTSSSGSSSGSTASPSAAATADPGSSSGADGTYTGDSVDIGHNYGNIQVEITVEGGRIVDVTTLEIPANDRRSEQISNTAIPYLVDQALQAQSTDVAGVSGATYTTVGFAASLKSALVQAGLA